MHIPTLNDFINEKHIGDFLEKIAIEIDVESTKHSEERKTRHGEDNPITNEEILQTVDKALEEVAKHQVFGDHKVGRKYWIYDKKNKDLNVVAQVRKDAKTETVKLVIITVMREKNFRGSSDAFKIVI